MRIRRIIQKDSTGCGLACAAMLSGSTYLQTRNRARDLNLVPDEDGEYYLNSRGLQSLLGRALEAPRRVVHWHAIDRLSIVGVHYHARKGYEPSWHWVVYVPDAQRGYVLDPLQRVKSTKRRDFWRMKPHRFIPVRRPNKSFKGMPLRGTP